jgi:catechol 2,3-dioxygenase-like lactoylglutathione lyase family enzyme
MRIRRAVPDLHGDPAASRSFYEDVIGMELAMDMGWIATFRSPIEGPVEVSVMSRDATAPVTPDVSIEVDDVGAVHARAVDGDCEIVHPLTDEPWRVRRFFVRDPNGAVINVLQHRATS